MSRGLEAVGSHGIDWPCVADDHLKNLLADLDGGTKAVRDVTHKVLSPAMWVIATLVLLHMLVDTGLFYLGRASLEFTVPAALGIQVSSASLMFVVLGLSLVFEHFEVG